MQGQRVKCVPNLLLRNFSCLCFRLSFFDRSELLLSSVDLSCELNRPVTGKIAGKDDCTYKQIMIQMYIVAYIVQMSK